MLEAALEVAMTTAREAGDLLRERLQSPLTIHYKGDRDVVTDADLAAQALIIGRLQASFPDHAIWAEEGDAATAGAGYTWIVDPLRSRPSRRRKPEPWLCGRNPLPQPQRERFSRCV